MIIVYGADWCEDTRRSLRHLRRLAVPHQYINIDEDLDALHRATALNGGRRQTPIIDAGLGGPPLVEPDNDSLTGALIEIEMLSEDAARERLAVQNVGDLERVMRTAAGAIVVLAAGAMPRGARWPLRIGGGIVALSGVAGWCPAYHLARTSSIDGPGDRPGESPRDTWLAPRSGDGATPAGETGHDAAQAEPAR